MPRIRLFRRVNLLTALLLGVGGLMLGVLLTAAALRGRNPSPPVAAAAMTAPGPVIKEAIAEMENASAPVRQTQTPATAPVVENKPSEDKLEKNMRSYGRSRIKHDDKKDKKGRKKGGKDKDDDD